MKYNVAVAVTTVNAPDPTTIRGFLRDEHTFEHAPDLVERLHSNLIENLGMPELKNGLLLYTFESEPLFNGEPAAVKKYRTTTIFIPRVVLNTSVVSIQIVETE